jgi:AcrR family transcriptional regulator
MPDAAADRARQALLRAGEQFAGRAKAVHDLDVAALVQAAGVSEPDFHECFGSLDDFRRELLRHMMDVVRAEVLATAAGFGRPGFERMWHTVEAFLDANLRHPAMRRLAYEMRTDPVAIELLRQRMAGYAMVFKTELAALDRPHPSGAARLATAMIVEAAKAEHEAGHAHAEVRRALHAFLKAYSG